ncbi:hypothetical protein HDU76_003131 [Blyttiomyces sp. JEL0837]|nr:hypothetical protein HDU76_003131 [Blyttiomyces sp. JEL0837]
MARFFMALVASAALLLSPLQIQALRTGLYRGKYNTGNAILPTDFSHTVFEGPILSLHGNVVEGPYVKENTTNGDVYAFGTIGTQCFLSRVQNYGLKQKAKIIDKSKKQHKGNCTAYDLVMADSQQVMYGAAVVDNVPTIFAISEFATVVDWTFYTAARHDLIKILKPYGTVYSAVITVDEDVGNVYVAWTMLDPETQNLAVVVTATYLDGSVSSAVAQIGMYQTAASGILILPGSVVLIAGSTLESSDGSVEYKHLSTFCTKLYSSADGTWTYDEPMLFNLTTKGTNPYQDQQIDAIASNILYDPFDGSIYLSAYNLDYYKSVVWKSEPLVPHIDITLPIRAISFPGVISGGIALTPNGELATITVDADYVRTLRIFDINLKEDGTATLPTNFPTEGQVGSILGSTVSPGTLIIGDADSELIEYQTIGNIWKIGASTSRVMIIHKVTNEALTMASDGTVHLFPIESMTNNVPSGYQYWDLYEGKGVTVRNAALGWALTIKGNPDPVGKWGNENGHRVVGDFYRRAGSQRWTFGADKLIQNQQDKLCLALDRAYLRDGRFPGKGGEQYRASTGIPVITAYCQYDKLITWEVVPIVENNRG